MTTRHFKDGDFEITITTHGKPDPHEAAQAILPWVLDVMRKKQELKELAEQDSKKAA